MNFNVICKTILEALNENLETIILMLIVVTSMYAINILFGTIIGSFKEKFNFDKFIFGVVKCLLADLGIFLFCYTLNLFALTLQLTKDITISVDFITTIEVITILYMWAIDLSKDIIEKIKSLKELKYYSYDDITKMTQAYISKETEV